MRPKALISYPQVGPVGHGVAKEVATIGDQEVKLLFHLWHLEEIVVITATKKDLCLSAILPVPGRICAGPDSRVVGADHITCAHDERR